MSCVAIALDQRLDQVLRGAVVAPVPRIEVPVDRPPLRVEAEAAAAPGLASHDPPGLAADVPLKPVLERLHALWRMVAAVIGAVVAWILDRLVDQVLRVRRVLLQAGRRDRAQAQAKQACQDEAEHPPGAQTFHAIAFGGSFRNLE